MIDVDNVNKVETEGSEVEEGTALSNEDGDSVSDKRALSDGLLDCDDVDVDNIKEIEGIDEGVTNVLTERVPVRTLVELTDAERVVVGLKVSLLVADVDGTTVEVNVCERDVSGVLVTLEEIAAVREMEGDVDVEGEILIVPEIEGEVEVESEFFTVPLVDIDNTPDFVGDTLLETEAHADCDGCLLNDGMLLNVGVSLANGEEEGFDDDDGMSDFTAVGEIVLDAIDE